MALFDYKTILNKSNRIDATKSKYAPLLEGFPDISTCAYCSIHDLEPKRCLHCGKILAVVSFTKGWKDNQIACSKECLSNLNSLVSARREETMIRKFGAPNASQCSSLVEKRKNTCRERFGSDSHLSDPNIREKIRNTNLEKYGVESPLLSQEIKDKIKDTNLKKYGVVNPLSSDSIREKITKTKKEKYGWEDKEPKRNYPIPHKRLLDHENMLILNDKEKLIELYEKLGSFALAERLGCNYQLVLSYLRKHDYQFKRQRISFLEKKMIAFLDEEEIGYKLHDRTILDGKEIDILLLDYKVGIEIHGNFYHSYSPLSSIKGIEDKNHSRDKYLLAKEKGITLLQFREDQINEKFEIVKSIIRSKIGKSQKVFARKTNIVLLDTEIAKDFCQENHVSGYASASVKLGLEYEGNIVSVMTFSKNRFSLSDEYEIIRFCSSKNMTVVGGGTKLLKYFMQNFSNKIHTYSDCMLGGGDGYLKMGFKFERFTEPGYSWVSPDGKIHSRMKYQRHKLNVIFGEVFAKEETEDAIMFSKGFRKLFNAGNNKFTLK